MNINSSLKPPINIDDNIDLIKLVKTFWNGRKTILKWMLFSGFLGLLIALLSPKEYTVKTTMVPQTGQSESKLGGLSSLAALAGFNLDINNQGQSVSPLLYPQILNSVPFQLELMNIPLSFSEVNHPISLFEYYTKIARPSILSLIRKYTLGLPAKVITVLKGTPDTAIQSNSQGLISLSVKQEDIRDMLMSKISLILDVKLGLLTLDASFHDPLISAQVAEKTRELLQKYITRYKIEKVKDQLLFVEGRYLEKKADFIKVQELLARFRDQNKNVSSALVRTEEERLQSDFSLASSVYTELAKQLEQAKIKVKEETPVFSIIEPVIIPGKSSKPKKLIIITICLFIGGIMRTAIIFGKPTIRKIRSQWNEPK